MMRPRCPGRLRLRWVLALVLLTMLLAPWEGHAQTRELCDPGPRVGDFDNLAVGLEYGVGSPISTGGLTLRVSSLEPVDGEPSGYAVVDPAEPEAHAGGSGLELFLNGVLLELASPASADTVTVRFGQGTAFGKLIVNGIEEDVEAFSTLDGRTLGGVHVSVTEGDGTGAIALAGPIDSFAIGGVELAIDDVVTESFCADLAIAQVTDTFVQNGTGIEFSVVLENIGNEQVNAGRLAISSAITERASREVGSLGPTESATFALTVPVPRGHAGETVPFSVTARQIDPGDEATLSNNELTVGVRVPQPDLVLTLGAWRFTDGQLVVPVGISNEGEATARQTTVTVVAAGWTGDSRDVRRIGPGGTVSITLEMAIPDEARGTRPTFTVRVDPDRIGDPDPSDNTRTFAADVPRIGETSGSGGTAWPGFVIIGAIIGVMLAAVVIWRLLHPRPPVVSALLRPGRTEMIIIPEPDGAPHHAVRLVPHRDPGVQLLEPGGKPR